MTIESSLRYCAGFSNFTAVGNCKVGGAVLGPSTGDHVGKTAWIGYPLLHFFQGGGGEESNRVLALENCENLSDTFIIE